MIRINTNIAIVDMVKTKKTTSNTPVAECFIEDHYAEVSFLKNNQSNFNSTTEIVTRNITKKRYSFEREILTKFQVRYFISKPEAYYHYCKYLNNLICHEIIFCLSLKIKDTI